MTVAAATIDFSANKPTIPNVGSNFGATGPYADYVLLETVGINSSCVNLEVQNQSVSAQIVRALDDGQAEAGAAPTNASIKVLAAAAAAGGAGGYWTSQTNKRRIQIYGPQGHMLQVSVFRDFN